MIKIENTDVVGLEHAIRGMRNPMNSWAKSDSEWTFPNNPVCEGCERNCQLCEEPAFLDEIFAIGPNDHDLMMRLCKAGSADAKFRRMIICYADITAPLYMLKEMDTYRMGVEKNSCSTMHKIASKEFDISDFSTDHLLSRLEENPYESEEEQVEELAQIYPYGSPDFAPVSAFDILKDEIIPSLNKARERFLATKDKIYWWQMIQLLPSSYNQRRTYMFSYEALGKIYRERRNHKLDEWHQFCDWVETLPYSEIITLKEAKSDE